MSVTRYTYGDQGEILAENRNGTESFYLFDGRGSTAFLVDDTGATTDSFSFSYYGGELGACSPSITASLSASLEVCE